MAQKKKDTEGMKVLPVLPLRDVIIFPHMVVPLFVGREKSINALDEAVANKTEIFLVAQRQASIINPERKDVFGVGTIGSIIRMFRLPDNTVKVLIEGNKRGRISDFTNGDRFVQASIQEVDDEKRDSMEASALVRSLKNVFENYVKLNKRIPPEMLMSVQAIDDASRLSDIIVAHLNLKLEDKQSVLEITEVPKRLEKLLSLIQGEIEILQVEKRIRSRVKKQMENSQKEYYLNEQMQAIQKELGEKDEFKTEIAALEKNLKAKPGMSSEAREKGLKELKKLKMMSPMSAEAAVIRNYLDWLINLPWGEKTEDNNDLERAEKILDEDHYGLDDVKERIVEYLAVRSLKPDVTGQILCLGGPPGVGKTSLARSVARSLERKFVRSSLGGVRDEAEIRGHRRTYVGALPGKIIQSMKKAGSNNPVFLLDEIDKMSNDFRGDPSSALLEVLDPEQNGTFQDHYLEVGYDLSNVTFIATANNLHRIPAPLLDRMETISISGYTPNEKFHIAKRHLWRKQAEKHGIADRNVEISDSAMKAVIRFYTKEAGVRNLERQLANLCRKTARVLVKEGLDKKIKITEKNLDKYLGVRKYTHTVAEEESQVGLVNGLAWTEVGGDILQLEASIVPGKGRLQLTGKLGEVMQESAHAAISFVRSRCLAFGIAHEVFQNNDIHIHVPEGAIPKDGPSAGVAIATALASALSRKPVKSSVGMTGEITLRGRVLPIGGIKEKILAAKLGGITDVIIPEENEKDLKKLNKEVLKGVSIHAVSHADEVLKMALELENPEEFYDLSRLNELQPFQTTSSGSNDPVVEARADEEDEEKESALGNDHVQ
jgi:ATP-dependent Lon protease